VYHKEHKEHKEQAGQILCVLCAFFALFVFKKNRQAKGALAENVLPSSSQSYLLFIVGIG
jgi:Mn2+/Fe2+ NRAMP family transporter